MSQEHRFQAAKNIRGRCLCIREVGHQLRFYPFDDGQANCLFGREVTEQCPCVTLIALAMSVVVTSAGFRSAAKATTVAMISA
ncbi:MAG: hypothetical protein HT580_10640 [Dechloromonas sp.]|nr:MAG: hypothetical protein HT580_10640 [Dechloromonas sp.]